MASFLQLFRNIIPKTGDAYAYVYFWPVHYIHSPRPNKYSGIMLCERFFLRYLTKWWWRWISFVSSVSFFLCHQKEFHGVIVILREQRHNFFVSETDWNGEGAIFSTNRKQKYVELQLTLLLFVDFKQIHWNYVKINWKTLYNHQHSFNN